MPTQRDGSVRLDLWMVRHDPTLSRSLAARLARNGEVTVNGRVARPSDSVRPGDEVVFTVPQAGPAAPQAEAIGLDIVHQDADIVVINKPAGMVVHPAAGHDTGTLVHALLGLGGLWSTAGGESRPGIVHRLDRGTSGLIVAARNDRAHRRLSSQLADHSMARTYQAIVRGLVTDDAGVLEGAIGRNPEDRMKMAVVIGGRHARTHYRVLGRSRGHTLLRCELETGRTHQVRVHLATFHHPIAGDRAYRGGSVPERPMLHAWRLRLVHPVSGREMEFEADPPSDFAEFWAGLQ